MGLALLPILAKRNRVLLARCDDLASRSVLARTAKRILDLSGMGQYPIDRSQHSMEELASHVASVREPVSRAVAALRNNGLIRVTRDTITVLDRNDLARAAHLDVFERT